MCGSAAVQKIDWLFYCCCKESKIWGTADVKGANLL